MTREHEQGPNEERINGMTPEPLVYCDQFEAREAFGPGWRRFIDFAFRWAECSPWFILYPKLRMGRRDGGLTVRMDAECYADFEDWIVPQMRLTAIAEESRAVCEACGEPAFCPIPRRSTRSHCAAHAMDWAAGIPEEVLWSTCEDWRADVRGWRPGDEEGEGAP